MEKPICCKLNARTNTELPNSYKPSASLTCTLKPGSASSIFSPEVPAGADSSAWCEMLRVLLILSSPMAALASVTRAPTTSTLLSCGSVELADCAAHVESASSRLASRVLRY